MVSNIGIAASAIPYAEPFVKWAGGKRSLLPQLLERVPETFRNYYEPFVGGGALFFALRSAGRIEPKSNRLPRAFLNDTNDRLMQSYWAVQNQPEVVIAKLRRMRNDEAYFLRQRKKKIDTRTTLAADIAAWFIFLNRTCFNGLYRVNKKGEFNVPFGDYANPRICNAENLRACSWALADRDHVMLKCEDFMYAAGDAGKTDFVYFDPPYYPRTGEEFTAYDAAGFGHRDHVRLRDLALRLKAKGAHVLISNSGADAVRELYAKGFEIAEVKGDRRIGARSSWRTPAPDLLIW